MGVIKYITYISTTEFKGTFPEKYAEQIKTAKEHFQKEAPVIVQSLIKRNTNPTKVEYRGIYYNGTTQAIALVKIPIDGSASITKAMEYSKLFLLNVPTSKDISDQIAEDIQKANDGTLPSNPDDISDPLVKSLVKLIKEYTKDLSGGSSSTPSQGLTKEEVIKLIEQAIQAQEKPKLTRFQLPVSQSPKVIYEAVKPFYIDSVFIHSAEVLDKATIDELGLRYGIDTKDAYSFSYAIKSKQVTESTFSYAMYIIVENTDHSKIVQTREFVSVAIDSEDASTEQITNKTIAIDKSAIESNTEKINSILKSKVTFVSESVETLKDLPDNAEVAYVKGTQEIHVKKDSAWVVGISLNSRPYIISATPPEDVNKIWIYQKEIHI